MNKQTKFALVDCNNFYVSCEMLFNPKLKGKVVVILSGNDGCVVARSPEAKAIGVKMGEPFFQCEKLVAQHNGVVISGNLVLYADISRRVMNVLKEITDKVHVYSIDEAFLEIDDIHENPVLLAKKIRKTLYKKVGISVSIGIATTKTLCKIAADLAKSNYFQYKGVVSLIGVDIPILLKDMSVREIWGIGLKTAQRLMDNRIFTVRQFVLQDEKYLRKIMGSKLPIQTYYELKGISCIPFKERKIPKSILCSRSLKLELSNIESIKNIIASFVMQAYRRLFKTYASARSIAIIMNENRYKVDNYKQSVGYKFEYPHRDFSLFLQRAKKIVDDNFDSRKKYKQIGVVLYDIQESSNVEEFLFTKENKNKSERLFDMMEFFNTKYSKQIIFPLSSKVNQEYSKNEFRSPRYTTNWNEILEIQI